MEVFVAVIEQGIFTAAALQFVISPTVASKKIIGLEKSLNTQLISRTPCLIKTTDIGQKYYIQCKKILHEYKVSHLIIESNETARSGTLHILCHRQVAQNRILPCLGNFLEYYRLVTSTIGGVD